MSEFSPNSNPSIVEHDEVISQALSHIQTVTFGLDTDAGVKEIESRSLAEQKKYEEQKQWDAKQVVSYLNRLSRDVLGKHYSTNHEGFGTAYNTPEGWLLFRKHFVSITPDAATHTNYGLLVNEDTYFASKQRHPFAVAVIAQNPTIIEGQLWQDTLAIADVTSGVASQSRNGNWMVANSGGVYFRRRFRDKAEYKILTSTDVHLVRFKTKNTLVQDVTVPTNQEIADAYNPTDKSFTFNPVLFTKYHPSETVYDMQRVKSLLPATLRDFPDFFANFVDFLSACKYFDETKANAELEKSIVVLLEKYRHDLDE